MRGSESFSIRCKATKKNVDAEQKPSKKYLPELLRARECVYDAHS